MTLLSLAPHLPVALAAVALGRSLLEGGGDAGRRRGARELAVCIALAAVALYLLGPLGSTLRERACVAGAAGVLWLVGRAQLDARLTLLLTCGAALLIGADPRAGFPFVPAVVTLTARAIIDGGGMKLAQRIALLFVVCAGIGYFAFGRHALPLAWPSLDDVTPWLVDALRRVGPVALAAAALGLVLALSGTTGGRTRALVALLALVADAAGARFSPVSALFVALAVGLGLFELAAHLGRSPIPGVRLTLAPLVVLVLAEPLILRAEHARLSWPDLGPVPPPRTTPRVIRKAP